MSKLRSVVVALAMLAVCAPGAGAASITKTAGDVTATLSWQKHTAKYDDSAIHPRLTVTRAGAVVFDHEITDICPVGCVIVEDTPEYLQYSSLKVADLDGDGEPEVIVDPFSGGAHCCIDSRVYSYRPAANTYARSATHHWFDADYTLTDLDGDGIPELSGYDASFSYSFTSYADSVFPPLVLSYRPDAATGKPALTDVTRKYPDLVKAHAAKQLTRIRKAHHDPLYSIQGAIAAYAADEYLLGQGSVARAELARDRKKGLTRKGFTTELLKFLKRLGYR